MSADEVCYLVSAPHARLPASHSVGFDYEVLPAFVCDLDGEAGVGVGMHDNVIGWYDKVPVERDTVIRDSSTGPSSHSGSGLDADSRRGGAGKSTSTAVAVDNGGSTGARIATGPTSLSTNIGVRSAGSPQASRAPAQASEKDFHNMFFRMFLVEANGEEIQASVLEGSYDQVIGYVRGCLDR